jgi:uncharacterized membrane protein YphA (DoxX/SURF4 family)
MTFQSPFLRRAAVLLARFGLSSAFLSSVADRFGAWGPPGSASATWGDFQHFVAATAALNPSAPKALVPLLAWGTTVLEAGLGLALLIGLATRAMALGAAALLLIFAFVMICSPMGLHAVFAHSLLTAAGAALLLSAFADRA